MASKLEPLSVVLLANMDQMDKPDKVVEEPRKRVKKVPKWTALVDYWSALGFASEAEL